MNLSEPLRPFFGNLSLAFALKQAVATFDEPVVRENRNSGMCFKNDFKSFAGSLKMRRERIVNFLSP